MMILTLKTFWALIMRDIAVSIPTLKDRIINAVIWCGLVLMVMEHIMPAMGLLHYGAFIAISDAASWGFFEVTENVSKLIADLEGDRSISYYLTLPIPQWMVFARIAITNALQALIIAVMFLPLSKLLLGDRLSFAQCDWFKMILVFILIHLFYGAFSLYLATKIKTLDTIGNVWMRIVFPLWFIGCYQFSWQVLFGLSEKIAYLDLLNPLVFCMEGARAAILGQEGYLPFWPCCGAIIIFTLLLGWIGTTRLMKRLDCL